MNSQVRGWGRGSAMEYLLVTVCVSLCICAYVGVSVPFLCSCVCLPLFSSSKSFSVCPPICTNHFCPDPTLDERDEIQTTALSAASRQAGELSHCQGCLESGCIGVGGLLMPRFTFCSFPTLLGSQTNLRESGDLRSQGE